MWLDAEKLLSILFVFGEHWNTFAYAKVCVKIHRIKLVFIPWENMKTRERMETKRKKNELKTYILTQYTHTHNSLVLFWVFLCSLRHPNEMGLTKNDIRTPVCSYILHSVASHQQLHFICFCLWLCKISSYNFADMN